MGMVKAGGDGPWVVTVMWTFVGVVLVFVCLRLYTRLIIVHSYGADDHIYNLAFVSLQSTVLTSSPSIPCSSANRGFTDPYVP